MIVDNVITAEMKAEIKAELNNWRWPEQLMVKKPWWWDLDGKDLREMRKRHGWKKKDIIERKFGFIKAVYLLLEIDH